MHVLFPPTKREHAPPKPTPLPHPSPLSQSRVFRASTSMRSSEFTTRPKFNCEHSLGRPNPPEGGTAKPVPRCEDPFGPAHPDAVPSETSEILRGTCSWRKTNEQLLLCMRLCSHLPTHDIHVMFARFAPFPHFFHCERRSNTDKHQPKSSCSQMQLWGCRVLVGPQPVAMQQTRVNAQTRDDMQVIKPLIAHCSPSLQLAHPLSACRIVQLQL